MRRNFSLPWLSKRKTNEIILILVIINHFSRYVEATPSWAKQLEGEMTRGKHMITFTASSPVGGPPAAKASCQVNGESESPDGT